MQSLIEDFDYPLPPELVAQYPAEPRDASRLLVLNRRDGSLGHARFGELSRFLDERDFLVVNDTRVFPARLMGLKDSGGRVEVLLHEMPRGGNGGAPAVCAEAQAGYRSRRRLHEGQRLSFGGGLTAEVTALPRPGVVKLHFRCDNGDLSRALSAAGEVPLPPYIRRRAEAPDQERYQTVFAREPGAIACPTAGLHFTPAVLAELARKGTELAAVTLHVGPGTFTPVRCADYTEHRLLPESFELSAETAARLNQARARGQRLVAVGTTTVRVLEYCAGPRGFAPRTGSCDLFIYPGYRFQAVERLVTNFHLPRSTLLLLVSAFAGRDLILKTYQEAIRERYRFYSYGDAMLIL